MLNNSFTKYYNSRPILAYDSGTNSPKTIYQTSIENHKDFEVIFIKKGYASITVNDTNFSVQKGSIIFLSPYMLHGFTMYPNVTLEYSCLCFDLSLILDASLVSNLENNHFFIQTHIDTASVHHQVLENLFKHIYKSLKTSEQFWEMSVQANLNLMFVYLMQNNLYFKINSPSATTTFSRYVMRYLDEHYQENINSSQIATNMHYHHSYFCRLFKKVFGTCFNEYLCLFRLRKAKFMLINSPDTSITDIALETGFSNVSYFTKKFKQQNEMTPSQFRQANKSIII